MPPTAYPGKYVRVGRSYVDFRKHRRRLNPTLERRIRRLESRHRYAGVEGESDGLWNTTPKSCDRRPFCEMIAGWLNDVN